MNNWRRLDAQQSVGFLHEDCFESQNILHLLQAVEDMCLHKFAEALHARLQKVCIVAVVDGMAGRHLTMPRSCCVGTRTAW